MSNIAIKYRLYPTTEQKIMFTKTFGCCRKVYNLMLSDKINGYKETKKVSYCYSCKIQKDRGIFISKGSRFTGISKCTNELTECF